MSLLQSGHSQLRYIFTSEAVLLSSHFTMQIQASGQRIEVFHKLQIECGITEPIKIPLHSNVRWGTAFLMLDRSYQLCEVSFFLLADLSCQAITLFVSTADQRYGPITTICRNGHVVKHIPWTSFAITETDWERVKQVCDILAVITS
jgi:hypothetical protein